MECKAGQIRHKRNSQNDSCRADLENSLVQRLDPRTQEARPKAARPPTGVWPM